VSDLLCAATLIVARHGEATYDVPGIATNDGGWLTPLGRKQARELGASLRDRRIAAVWCSDLARAVQTAELVAGVLGGDLPVQVRSGLREFGVGELAGHPITDLDAVFRRWVEGDLSSGCPGAETGEQVVARMQAELESAADTFRGETVLMVSHGGVMGAVLPLIAANLPNDYALGRPIANTGACELAVDADSWLMRTWNSRPV
jgi:probable phosphoglycerate mutase